MNELLNEEQVLQLIHNIRNLKVMLDSDLAEMYGVQTKVLNQSVKRNP
ncbi:ORF6N domain-containing protein [Algoriphagus chordae]|uniref:ORF6N domain-containing protein n=1 Tax=Algoriphagus chordae TaxID=237019 RepID=A0A2W7R4T1_9BACT|nr:ORF6N domain-containing protein [Algoriphagus chordae]PZX53300.1 ORF6N domain-containing protein [Algoriphagus chordae]